jgi:hypothetical protein
MGELSDIFKEFQDISREYYRKSMQILTDEYCWKCPMRSTSSNTHCREVHAWRKLQEAMEDGIADHLLAIGISTLEKEDLYARIQRKRIKKQGGKLKEFNIHIRLKEDLNSQIPAESVLLVRVNPKRVQTGEQVLIPDKSLKPPLFGSCALLAGLPFQVATVKKYYHEGNIWRLETGEGVYLPLESVLGVLIRVMKPEDPDYPELG